jgi:excisionase family DNA binding protein
MPGSSLSRFVTPNGSLVIPPRAVGLADRLLVLGMTAGLKSGQIQPFELNVLVDAMEQAATRAVSEVGTTLGQGVRLDSDEELLTISQAAMRADRTDRAIRYAVERGQIRGIKPGHQWLIRASDLDDYMYGRAA